MKEKIKQLIHYHHIKHWYEAYERFLMPATLVAGVVLDWITFATINITSTFVLLGIYFIIATVAIVYQHTFDAHRIPHYRFFQYLRLAIPLLIQFTFGALLSGTFIFYWFSGTIFVSWPFIILLVILMVSNDVFREYYLRPRVQSGVYFFIIFSLLVTLLPFIFHSIEPWVFIVGGFASLLFMGGFFWLLSWVVLPLRHDRRTLAIIVGIIFGVITSLYFFNIIPPIPLSVRDSALAHDLKRENDKYTLLVERETFWEGLRPGRVFHKEPSGRVYVYTAIFAPQELDTVIVHHWQQYDEVAKDWVTRDKLTFQIVGGTKMGYRGYSVKTNVPAGKWRVDVETERGQVLGQVRFRVEAVSEVPVLETIVK